MFNGRIIGKSPDFLPLLSSYCRLRTTQEYFMLLRPWKAVACCGGMFGLPLRWMLMSQSSSIVSLTSKGWLWGYLSGSGLLLLWILTTCCDCPYSFTSNIMWTPCIGICCWLWLRKKTLNWHLISPFGPCGGLYFLTSPILALTSS